MSDKTRPIEQRHPRDIAASEYCNRTITSMMHVDEMSDDAVVHNLRFMAFCAGWKEAQRWVRCDEELPELHVPVLVISGGGPSKISLAVRMIDDEVEDWDWFYPYIEGCGGPALVTHWMMLPELPEGMS